MDKKILNDSELENVSGGISEMDKSIIDIQYEIEMEKRRALENQLKEKGLSDDEIAEAIKAMERNAPRPDTYNQNPIIF